VSSRCTPKDSDLYAWLLEQASALGSHRTDRVDWAGLAEELEAMAAREKRELVSHLRTLLAHLLKSAWQPERKSRSWELSITRSRMEVSDLLDDSPSLRAALAEALAKAYERARREAGIAIGYDRRRIGKEFPKACPWLFEQIMDEDFSATRSRRSNGHN
jgi:hypothetical protein